jgi:hypothetical protein
VTNSSTTSGTAIKATGIARTDGDINFAAVEDLGGGLKASINMAIATGARSVDAGNRDGSIMLSGGFGTVTLGSLDAGNGIYGLGSAGASYLIGIDANVIPDSGNIDYMSYTSPAINGFNFKVTSFEVAAVTSGTNSLSGYAMHSSTALQDGMVYGVSYANGPLSAAADVTTYGDNAVGTTAARADGRTRISASYNLGVAVIGAGFETRDAKAISSDVAVTTKDTIIGVHVPVGAFDFGVVYATSKTDGAGYTKKGVDVGARYNFSKRTYAMVGIQSLDNVNLNGTAGSTNEGKITRIQLSHAF